MKLLIPLISLFLLLGCSSDSEVIPPIMSYSYSTDVNRNEVDLIERVNNYRVSNGLTPLQSVEHIGYLCSKHNQNMIETGMIGNQNFQERSHNLELTMNATKVSELIGYNYNTNQSVIASFLASPPCKKILDESDKSRIGVAINISPSGRKYYTLIFIN